MISKDEVLLSLNFRDFYGAVFGDIPRAKSGWCSPLMCPFHDEEHPSFSVNIDHGGFNCFGCAEKGDIFKFVMLLQGGSFTDALYYLASFAGVSAESVSNTLAIPSQKESQINWKRLFRSWESWALDHISRKIRHTERMLAIAEKMDDLDDKAVMRLDTWKYHWNILFGEDDSLKYELFHEHIRSGGNDI